MLLRELNDRFLATTQLSRGEEYNLDPDEVEKHFWEYSNPTGSREDTLVTYLPRMREKLLEPLLMEEEDAGQKVAEMLWNYNFEPRHLFVHMRQLQHPVLQEHFGHPNEDLFSLVTDKMKAEVVREYRKLEAGKRKGGMDKLRAMDPSALPTDDGIISKKVYRKGEKPEPSNKGKPIGGKRAENLKAMEEVRNMEEEAYRADGEPSDRELSAIDERTPN
mmetsp:Transcript_23720/g.57462  ORF Transcript_23720/g.57462 Transcript_23720/m.57462 type:complete len:219 (+) Transcript_23720:1198-1854(+)